MLAGQNQDACEDSDSNIKLKAPLCRSKPCKVVRMLISCEYAGLHIWLIWEGVGFG